jgi:phosphocarrier protein HPr
MIEKVYTINNKLGLHARPASLFVKTTGRFQSAVKVKKGDNEIDGKSIMGLLMLAAGPGTPLTIRAEGQDEEGVIQALDDLFARRFDDEDKE